MNFKYFKLDNGFRVIFLEKKGIGRFATRLFVKTGSKNDPKQYDGLAHLFEHLMFEGSTGLAKGKYDSLVSSAGGSSNASTSYDLTNYKLDMPKGREKLAIWLEAERFYGFNPNQDALDNQKSVICEEINQIYYSKPYSFWHVEMANLSFSPNSVYHNPVAGGPEGVMKTPLSAIFDFHNDYYNTDNACLVVSGDFDQNEALEAINKYFSIEKKTNTNKELTVEKNYGLSVSKADRVPSDAIFLSFHLPGLTNQESSLIAEIFAVITGSSPSSLITQSLVNQMSVATAAGAFADERELASLYTIYAYSNHNSYRSQNLFDALAESSKRMFDIDYIESELSKAKNQFLTEFYVANENFSSIASQLGQYAIYFDDPSIFFRQSELVKNITSDKLLDFANTYIDFEKACRVDIIES